MRSEPLVLRREPNLLRRLRQQHSSRQGCPVAGARQAMFAVRAGTPAPLNLSWRLARAGRRDSPNSSHSVSYDKHEGRSGIVSYLITCSAYLRQLGEVMVRSSGARDDSAHSLQQPQKPGQTVAHQPDVRSLADILAVAPWVKLEEHLDHLRERVDGAVIASHKRREELRAEILSGDPALRGRIRKPGQEALDRAKDLLRSGIVAAADGTVAPVSLLSGTKIQVGVVVVTNTGDSVRLVTRVFEHELATQGETAREFFENLRKVHGHSNLASRALMLFGERQLLLGQEADWRMIHGELVPYELRTGVGMPSVNLPPVFELVRKYVENERFIAVSEGPEDLEVLNAAIILEPGEYIELRTLSDDLTMFLEGDEE